MKVVVLVALLAVASAALTEQQLTAQWASFKAQHGKNYAAADEAFRFGVFRENLQRAEELNNMPGQTATFGMTKFSDMTPEEFAKTHLNYRGNGQKLHAGVYAARRAPRVSEYDWRDHGAITATKDQGHCGSCWAFSAVEQMESAWFLAGNTLTELSTQQVTSCDIGGGDYGCNGGDTVTAYKYMISAGLEGEDDYPYVSGTTGSTGQCKHTPSQVRAKMSNFTYATDPCFDSCDNQDEDKLKDTLMATPVSICVYATVWQSYMGGILSSNCPYGYRQLNHCTQLTGFATSDAGQEYWKIRNSWGTDWGVEGYIHILKGKNLCGVADEATVIGI